MLMSENEFYSTLNSYNAPNLIAAAVAFETNLAKAIAPTNSYSISDEKLRNYFLVCDYCNDLYEDSLKIELSDIPTKVKVGSKTLTLAQGLALTRLIVDTQLDRSIRKVWINKYCLEWRPTVWKTVQALIETEPQLIA